ncbi:hypothetical protein L484_018212 [Morus notabilis]|uniref:Inner centromere protein ARK-binding domain-containing protein n=1 Tax=Morus notabilis TaxID=981085 RepID=W9QQI1_9ROSA|nr:hypothetical protein L484_018212 [Morus notabilis]
MAAAERVKMTTIEKLMIQIFEKKSRILEHVKQQIHLFDHHLASKLLIDGIAPPPWLLTSDLPSRTSDPAELNAEDLISEVLLSRQQRPAIPFLHSHCLVYEKPVAEVTTGQLPNGLCTEEVRAENKAFNEGDNPCSDVGCASVGVSTLDHCITVPQDQRDEDPSIPSPQDQRDTRISDDNHDLALSLARLHRSKSRQRALELRNSAKVDKCQLGDDNNLSGCSRGNNGSVVPFLQVDQLEEMDSVKTLDTSNDNCVVEDANLGDTWSKEKGSRIDSREVTRFRSPGLQQSSLNVDDSSNVVREDDAMLMESVGLSIQQSNHRNQSLEPVSNSLIDDQNGRETKSKVGNKRSKEKGSNTNFRRITRSKLSTEQNNRVTELFELDGSRDKQKERGTSSLTRQAQLLDRGEINKSANIVEKGAGLKRVTQDYSGRITRSRSSRLPSNTVYDLSKPVSLLPDQENLELCVVSGTEHLSKRDSAEGYISKSKGSQGEASYSNVNTHISAEKAFTIQEEEKPFAANSTDVSDGENNVDESVGRNTRTKPNFTAEITSELVRSEGLGRRVNLFASNSSPKQLETKSLNSSGRISCNVSGLDVKGLPCTSTSQSANLEGCVATVTETEIVPVGPDEVHPVCLGSNANGNGFVGLEVLATCPADTSMHVEPKQLNFDDVEVSSFTEAIAAKKENERLLEKSPALSESAGILDKAMADVETSTFNGMSALAVEKENEGRLLERSPPVLSESSGILDKVMPENYQENYNVSLEETVDLSEEEPQRDSSEVKEDDTSTTVIALEEHVLSPAKETSHVEKNILAQNLQQSDKNSKARSSLTGNLVTTQAPRESMPGILLKDVTISNLSDLNVHTGMDPSVETETRTLVDAKPTELVPKVSELETLSVDRELSEDADFPQVTKPDTYAEQEACTDHTVELPCAVSKDESMGNLAHATVNLDMFQSHTVEPLDRCSHEDTSIDQSQSTQRQITAKSVAKTSSVEGSWIRNKRKRSNPLDTLSNSPGKRENHVLSVNKDGGSRNLLNEERSPKAILESKDFQVSPEDVTQSVIRGSQVEELHQNHDTNVPEDYIFSPKFQVETIEFSLEERDRNANSSTTFANKGQQASFVATEARHAVGDCESQLMEETRDADPTSIVYDGEWQCSLQESGNSYHLEEKFENENTECVTNDEALMQEEIPDLVGTSKFSCSSVGSPRSPSLYLTRADETMPVLERFVMQSDDEQPCNADEGISFDKLNLSNSMIERASILEQLCKSACMQTPASCSSPSYKLHKFSNLYLSVPTGLLEGTDTKDKLPSHARSHSDCLPGTTSYCDWDIKKPCLSPVRKVWDRIIESGSSEKRRSLNPELPCINEENENMEEVAYTYQEGIVTEMLTSSVKREPLAEIDANLAPSEAETYTDRFSLESVNTEFSFQGTHNKGKKNAGNGRSIRRRYNNKENETLGSTSLKGKLGSLHNRTSKPKLSAKTNSRKGGLSITETETKRSNILSNITSFIPLVQQKQAPAVVTGKRDVKKVKALEAAEAAKRAAEKKENERKLKKEAMKLERTRQEQENLRQLELQKKRKEEERKKKETEMAAKKRQREEEEKKEKERKRLHVEETRKQQKEQEQKLQAAKEVKNRQDRNMDEKGHEIRESKVEKKKYKMEKGKGDDNFPSISEAEPTTTRASTSDDRRAGIVHKEFEASSDAGNSLKGQVSLMNNLGKPTRNENLAATTRQEESYDISPYKCSDDEDDEDEEDEDVPNGKFVPSWARYSFYFFGPFFHL